MTVIDGYGAQAVPITVTGTGSATVSSPYTFTAATATTPYTTTDPAPSISVSVTTAYTGLSAYATGPTPSNPPPTALYYWLSDNSVAAWTPVTPSTAAGSNPATFPVTLSGKAPWLLHPLSVCRLRQ